MSCKNEIIKNIKNGKLFIVDNLGKNKNNQQKLGNKVETTK
jgi:hypothetical protein